MLTKKAGEQLTAFRVAASSVMALTSYHTPMAAMPSAMQPPKCASTASLLHQLLPFRFNLLVKCCRPPLACLPSAPRRIGSTPLCGALGGDHASAALRCRPERDRLLQAQHIMARSLASGIGVLCLALLASSLVQFVAGDATTAITNGLLAMQSVLDPTNQLKSWNASTTFCNWEGITCSGTTIQSM